MFTTGHQRVSVTAFCEAGRAWNLPKHSGMAHQELCLAIPDPEKCLPCPSRAGPHDLSALITSIPLRKPDLIPQPPHSSLSPPTQPPTQPDSPPPALVPESIFSPHQNASSLRGGLGLLSPQLKIEQKCFQTHSKNFRV